MGDGLAGDGMQQRHLPAVLVDRFAGAMDVASQRDVRGVGARRDQFVGDEICRKTFADAAEVDRDTWRKPNPVVRDLEPSKPWRWHGGDGLTRSCRWVGNLGVGAVVAEVFETRPDGWIEQSAGFCVHAKGPLECSDEIVTALQPVAPPFLETIELAVWKKAAPRLLELS